jgi:hypothetical protein
MDSFLLWISLFSLIYSKWISNNIVHSYNDTKITIKENIIDSMNIPSRFLIAPHELDPHEVVHFFMIWNI